MMCGCLRWLLWAVLGLGGPVLAQGAAGLEAALRATLSQHPAVAGKTAEVDAKAALGDVAQAQRYPTLSGQLAAQDRHTTPSTLRARQPVWAFGRIDSQLAHAQADVGVEQADLLRVRRQLIEQTAVAYARVQGIYQRQQVALDNIARHEELHGQIQRRERGELASRADVRLAASRLIQARAQKERLDGELAVALNELQALTQVVVDTSPPVAPQHLALAPEPTLETLALDRSADLALRARQVDLARADAERERSSSMPTVYLQYERSAGQPGVRSDARVGLVVEGSLDGMGFAARGRSRAAGARLQAALEGQNAVRTEVQRNVRSLISNRRMQAGLKQVEQQSVQELEEILASYRRQYEAGRKAWLDVLNVQREVTEQRLLQVQADNEWLVYSLRLTALTGGLDAPAAPIQE
ncbi:TolC family protein [Aquabacterium sp. A7-Y]|uniref:TolC family protein n=1 Tax=Aquabacterium sp. A7-Y TaxID=1349605 RepID=UPI00223DCC82|nr:TolC family protein [Aquabacterium sp. A7-Y]MCW7541884.1 TolC family protein [Aquabacterium sp. A7-Y]